MTAISEQDLLSVAAEEGCRARLDERTQAASPTYAFYTSSAQEFLKAQVFPPWRTNQDASEYIGVYEVPREEAFPISYFSLSEKPELFASLPFDSQVDYLSTNKIICFHCQTCGVRVVKDGNHRLLQCALRGLNPELQIYEVRSADWSASQIDMKNFCKCIYNNALQATCEGARD